MEDHEDQFPVRLMCRALSVTHGGYYAWKRRAPSHRNEQLAGDIKRIFDDEMGRELVRHGSRGG